MVRTTCLNWTSTGSGHKWTRIFLSKPCVSWGLCLLFFIHQMFSECLNVSWTVPGTGNMTGFKPDVFVDLVLGFWGKTRMNNRWLNCCSERLCCASPVYEYGRTVSLCGEGWYVWDRNIRSGLLGTRHWAFIWLSPFHLPYLRADYLSLIPFNRWGNGL